MSDRIQERLKDRLAKANISIEKYTNIDRLLKHPDILEDVANLISEHLSSEGEKFGSLRLRFWAHATLTYFKLSRN